MSEALVRWIAWRRLQRDAQGLELARAGRDAGQACRLLACRTEGWRASADASLLAWQGRADPALRAWQLAQLRGHAAALDAAAVAHAAAQDRAESLQARVVEAERGLRLLETALARHAQALALSRSRAEQRIADAAALHAWQRQRREASPC